MAITSSGYDGPITETSWALMSYMAGPGVYTVGNSTADLRVSAVANADRTVNIAAGAAYGKGVIDQSDSPVQLQLDTVATGSRWDMIVLRRDWGTNTSSFAIVKGTADDMTAFNARNVDGGTLDDQPLALVQVTAGTQTPTGILDLRIWAYGGGMVAAHDYARRYVTQIGTEIRIGSIVWQLGLDVSGITQWYKRTDGMIPLLGTGPSYSGGAANTDGQFFLQAGTVAPKSDSGGYYSYVLPKPFPTGLLYAGVEIADDLAGPGYTVAIASATRLKIDWGLRGPSGARLGNVLHRVNWIAIGW